MRKNLLYLTGFILCVLISSSTILAQTTTTGHESARAEINFTEVANYFAAHPLPVSIKKLENDDDDSRPPVAKPDVPSLVHTRPEPLHSAYVPASSGTALLPVSPAPTDSFQSTLDDGTSIPPDTHGDVGGNYCVTAINTTVRVQNRTGTTLSTMSLDAFWNAVLPGGGSFDPRIFYDRYNDRWYMIADANGDLTTSALLMAVSKTNNPTGAWFEFIVPVGTGGNWVDYPTVGFNKKWIAVGGNPFNVASSASAGASVFIFNKALLLAGTSATFTRIDQPSSFTICPAVMYDTTDPNLFAVESWDGTTGKLQEWKITGPVGAPVMSVVGQPSSGAFHWQFQSSLGGGGGDFAPQTGTANKIQNNDDRIFDLKYMNGHLWCSHNVFLPATGATTHCSAQWWEFDTLANPMQIGLINDNAVTNMNFYYFPAIAVNQYDDALIGFSTSSALTHVNCAYALHLHTDPTDSIRPPFVYRHGQASYYKTFGGGRDRWGDYSQSSVDTNLTDFWTLQEVAASPANTWDTWWAYVRVCIPPVSTITVAGPTTVCLPATVLLNANTGTGLTYQWEKGGVAIVGATTSSYTATVTGTYNVIVYNSATCDSVSLPVTVSVNPAPSAITGTMTACPGGTTSLGDASSGGTWSSSTPAVGTIGTGGIVTGIAAGTTTISYTVSAGCVVTAIVTVNPTFTATITPGGPTTFCSPGSVVLTGNGVAGDTYQWQSGGVNIPGATSMTYTASTGGNYTIIITNSSGCSATSAVTAVTVNTVSAAAITGGSTVCIGQTTTLSDATGTGTWSSGNTGLATVDAAGVVTGVSAGVVTISYIVTNACGTATATTNVTVSAGIAVAAISGGLNVCAGNTTSLSDATGAGVWSSSNTGVATVSASGLVSGLTAGTANISYSVTSGSGCLSSAVATVTVNALPSAVIAPAGPVVICTGGAATFTASAGAGYTYQWQNGGVNIIGATNASYTATAAGNYGYIVTSASGCSSTSAVVGVTVGLGVTVVPSVNITSSLGTVLCSSTTPSTFTATPSNGGTTPVYQWTVNGVVVGTGSTYSYIPGNGDVVTCLLTSNAPCAFPDTASATLVMTVSPYVNPAVSIQAYPNDTVCTGDTIMLAAIPVYGGTAPTYLWTQNGTNVATGPYYIYHPMNGDTVVVHLTSNYPCLATPFATSGYFIIHVDTPMSNSLSVSVSQSSIVSGSVDTFFAVATNAGSAPAFQWYINGAAVPGATSFMYVTDSLTSDQIVLCKETSSYVCATPQTILSGGLSVTVIPSGIKQVGLNAGNFTLLPNPNNGEFTINGSLKNPGDDRVNIVMTNILGQTVYRETTHAQSGSINTHISTGRTLPRGNYLVTVTSGEDHVVFHVVINK